MSGLFLILMIVFLVLWQKTKKQASNLQQSLSDAEEKNRSQDLHIKELSKYQDIVDVAAEVKKLRDESEKEIQAMRNAADQDIADAKQEAKELREKGKARYESAVNDAEARLASVDTEAKRILSEAESRAKEIPGEAYEVAGKAKE